MYDEAHAQQQQQQQRRVTQTLRHSTFTCHRDKLQGCKIWLRLIRTAYNTKNATIHVF